MNVSHFRLHVYRAVLLTCLAVGAAVPMAARAQDANAPADVIITLPKFWIGVLGEPASETLKAQLKLESGVVVMEVVDDSPAAKAGLKQHDLVVKLNDEPVSDIRDFLQPVAKSEGKPIVLDVMRGGEHQRIEVQPSERPEQSARLDVRPLPPDFKPGDMELPEGLRARMANLHVLGGDHDRLRMLFVNPGVVLGGMAGRDLPAEVSVSVTKQGDEPAKIVVTRGDDRWETTADKLGELPEEVRGWAHAIVGPPDVLQLDSRFRNAGPGREEVKLDVLIPAQGDRAALEQRLDKLAEELKALQNTVDKLQQGQ